MQRTPCADPPFERSTNAGGELRVAPPELVEYRHRSDARRRLEQRDDLGLEDIYKRIGPAALARRLLVGRQPRVMPEAVALATLIPACAAAAGSVLVSLSFMNNLI